MKNGAGSKTCLQVNSLWQRFSNFFSRIPFGLGY